MKLKKLLKGFVFIISTALITNAHAQVIFTETFGQSTVRLSSQYVPQTGQDASSITGTTVFKHGSKFYYPAIKYFTTANQPSAYGTLKSANTDIYNINDGYYTVIAPSRIYNFALPSEGLEWTGNWWQNISDHTGDTNGAVLALNAGEVKNQFYRRAVSLQKGKTYKMSAWFYGSGSGKAKFIFQAQNIATETSLGDSSDFTLNDTSNEWQLKEWTFKIPNYNDCGNVAIAIRNQLADNVGNDLYIDDIKVEEVIDPNANEIACANTPNFDSIIKANDDFVSTTSSGGTYTIIGNDNLNGTTSVVLTGTSQNATISTVGVWPNGYSLNTNGQLVVASNATPLSTPLQYQICNLLGVCSIAKITINPFTPGSISTTAASTQCDGAEVTVKANSIAIDGLKIINYRWQVSYDNGTTWTNISSYNGDGLASVTFNLIEGTAIVRREARSNTIAQTNYQYSYTTPVTFTVIKNHLTFSTSDSFVIQKGGSVTIPTITTTYPGTVVITDENQNTISQGQTITYPNVGVYEYVITASMSGPLNCPVKKSIFVSVYDLIDCTKQKERVFATSQTSGSIITGNVSDGPRAVDNDMSTYSTIEVIVGLLGIGTTWQNLNFGHKVNKGTPAIVKLGQEYSGVQAAGGITVNAVDQNNNSIGPLIAIGEGALLDLLVGDNVFEFKFIPKGYDGKPVDYYGIRVNSGGLLALASNTKVFGAYYEKDKTATTDCTLQTINATGAAVPAGYVGTVKLNNWVSDVSWGIKNLGLGVADIFASVVYPYLAVDDNLDTYTIFNKAVSLLNKQVLDVKLRQVARPGDEIRILMGGFNIAALDLSLLTDFKVQRYLGDIKVGTPVTGNGFKLLDLNLLALLGGPNNRKALVVSSTNQPFDRIEISYLSTAQVGLLGDYPYLYDVSIMPRMTFDGFDGSNPNILVDLCANEYLKVNKTDICTTYEISFATANKNGQGETTSYTTITNSDIAVVQETPSSTYYSFNSLLSQYNGNLYLKIQTKRQNCDYGGPQYIKVNLKNCKDAIVNPILNSAGQ